jgi:hypothetical protein
MKAIRDAALCILIIAVFATTLCAQACLLPAPDASDCPIHHGKDCCKHEGNNPDRATVDALAAHLADKHSVALPIEMTLPAGIELRNVPLWDDAARLFTSAPLSASIPIPLTLRI